MLPAVLWGLIFVSEFDKFFAESVKFFSPPIKSLNGFITSELDQKAFLGP